MEPDDTFSEGPGGTPEPTDPARIPSGGPAKAAPSSLWRWAGFMFFFLLAASGTWSRLFDGHERLPSTFSNENVSLTYPAGWSPSSDWDQEYCGQLGIACLSKATYASGEALITVVTFPFWGSDALIEGVALNLAAQSEQDEDIVREEARWHEVDGKRAYEILNSADNPTSGMRNYARSVFVIHNRRMYIIEMIATNELTLRLRDAEFEALLDSVTFSAGDD